MALGLTHLRYKNICITGYQRLTNDYDIANILELSFANFSTPGYSDAFSLYEMPFTVSLSEYSPFSLQKLESAVPSRWNSAPGSDSIDYSMIKLFPTSEKLTLLKYRIFEKQLSLDA